MEEYVRLVVDWARPLPILLAEVVEATSQDDCLQMAIEATQSSDWCSLQCTAAFRTVDARARLRALLNVRHKLSVSNDGCFLRGLRLVLPSCLVPRAVLIVHGAHQGIVKSENQLRSKVWFQGLDQQSDQEDVTPSPEVLARARLSAAESTALGQPALLDPPLPAPERAPVLAGEALCTGGALEVLLGGPDLRSTT
ncbi:hypothetical protein NDU88_003782 [Pleurodeles waltl]|uniref:Uncharacterized protein n=1 Tax=Pleurodeles waltl TaxID=8319 RepID=A0AAV7MRK8_PLEWA|nr:hypothetical protein NDU88_003782 [Pleurodeles waltl]